MNKIWFPFRRLAESLIISFQAAILHADPMLYCPCEPIDWRDYTAGSEIARYNAFNRNTSIISALDFKTLGARSAFTADHAKSYEFDQSIILRAFFGETFGEFLNIHAAMNDLYRGGGLFDSNFMWRTLRNDTPKEYLDDFGNASYAYSAYKNIPIYRTEIGGVSGINWIAGAVEFRERAYYKLLKGKSLNDSDVQYLNRILVDPEAALSMGLDNDIHDFLVIQEVQRFLEFNKVANLDEILHSPFPNTGGDDIGFNSEFVASLIDRIDEISSSYDYDFLSQYNHSAVSQPNYSLGNWDFHSVWFAAQ